MLAVNLAVIFTHELVVDVVLNQVDTLQPPKPPPMMVTSNTILLKHRLGREFLAATAILLKPWWVSYIF